MDDSQKRIRSLGSITKPDSALQKERAEKAHKSLEKFLEAQSEFHDARYAWYLADYELRLEGKAMGSITDEEFQKVVRRFGRAVALHSSTEYELRGILGL